MNRTYTVVLTTVLVVLAGCSGGVPGGTATDGPTAGTTTGPGGTTGSTGSTGTVNFYVSDEPNAIDDFEHLNVTITKVGFHEAGEEGESPESTETATATGTETSETTETATTTGTETPETTETATATDTETAETTETATATGTETPEGTDTATESPEETDGEGDDDEEGREGWQEFEVDSKTVDLTELRGNNATLVGQFELDNGTYDKVFVYISDVNGTLKTGEQVNVKLPSERLHINKRFTVGANESVDFVYDITVFKAGKSGKYILKPVVSESGTDVEIEPTDENGTDDGEDADDGGDLEARFVGTVEPGESATVKVTRKGEPVENATVTVNGTEYRTTADGTVTFDVPENAEELEVTVEYEGDEVELERTFDDSGGGEDGGQQDGERPTSTSTPTTTSTSTST